MKRRHVTLEWEKKARILNEIENGISYSAISKKYGVGKSTITDIKKKKNGIEAKLINTSQKKRKTLKSSKFEKMEDALYFWFLQKRSRHQSISGENLKAQALSFFRGFYESNENFTASDGWLHKFKSRYGLRYLTVVGEKLSCDQSVVKGFKKEFLELISEMNLTTDQIYNADESALFWKQFKSKKTLVSVDEKSAPGGKEPKNRITFMPCSNASGRNKLPLMVLGTAQNPRPFKNIVIPLSYYSSKKGWMTREVFEKWFHSEFVPSVRQFSAKNNITPSAVLLLDNAPSHHTIMQLKSDDGLIKVFYLPPNCTAILQPMDQNLICTIKKKYRRKLIEEVLLRETIEDGLEEINLRDVVFMLKDCWDSLSMINIQHSWKLILSHLVAEESLNEPEDIIPLTLLTSSLRECQNITKEEIEVQMNMLYEEEDVEHDVLNNYEILDYISHLHNDENDDMNGKNLEETRSENEGQYHEVDTVSPILALQSIENVLEFCKSNNFTLGEQLLLRKIKEKIKNLI